MAFFLARVSGSSFQQPPASLGGGGVGVSTSCCEGAVSRYAAVMPATVQLDSGKRERLSGRHHGSGAGRRRGPHNPRRQPEEVERELHQPCWPTTPPHKWTLCWETTAPEGRRRRDGRRHHGRTAGLLHLLTSGRAVGRLPHGERAGHADAGRHHGRAAGLPDGPGPGRVHNQPNHLGAGGVPLSRRPGHSDGVKHRRRAAQLLHHRTSRRPPRQARSHSGGADEAVAAIGEQILGPTDVSPSNWTVRPSSGCSVVLATHTAGVSVDGYTLTLAA